MFSGGDDGAQTSQDNTAADPAAADNGLGLPEISLPASAPSTDAAPAEASELPAIVPPTTTPVVSAPANSSELLNIKQQALQQLSPMLGHLDQTPEERFRTTMMMIQASDNSSLLKVAYEAAQQISNEKERARALLDVVNEINYFTQQEESGPAAA